MTIRINNTGEPQGAASSYPYIEHYTAVSGERIARIAGWLVYYYDHRDEVDRQVVEEMARYNAALKSWPSLLDDVNEWRCK